MEVRLSNMVAAKGTRLSNVIVARFVKAGYW